MGFQLIDDIGHIDGDVVVVENAVKRARSCADVVRLARMSHAVVVGGKPGGRSCKVNKGALGLPISVS